jgi:hypothetical protein
MPLNPADPHEIGCVTYAPSQGLLHASYWRRLNHRYPLLSPFFFFFFFFFFFCFFFYFLFFTFPAFAFSSHAKQTAHTHCTCRMEVASEVQMLLTGGVEGRREAVANVGFKLDTVYATIRGAVDTMGKVSAILEERMAPGLSFQVWVFLFLLVFFFLLFFSFRFVCLVY